MFSFVEKFLDPADFLGRVDFRKHQPEGWSRTLQNGLNIADPKCIANAVDTDHTFHTICFQGFSNKERPFLRASSLSLGATPSSSSIQTISAPEARAFGNISGLRPGVKIKLRRGRMLSGCEECFMLFLAFKMGSRFQN